MVRVPRVAVCLVTFVAVVAAVCGESMAQTTTNASGATANDSISREWALRGVIVSEFGGSAVLEYLPSGRQQVVGLGAAVTPTVTVVKIDGEHVVLGTDGGATTALRLGHGGGQAPVVRARVPPRPTRPPRVPWPRRR
jgi:hypothetical protein